jgi:hypothetical protein
MYDKQNIFNLNTRKEGQNCDYMYDKQNIFNLNTRNGWFSSTCILNNSSNSLFKENPDRNHTI